MSTEFSLEKKIKELEAIEAYFQESNIDLEKAIGKHSEAIRISKEILEYLQKVETRIEEIELPK